MAEKLPPIRVFKMINKERKDSKCCPILYATAIDEEALRVNCAKCGARLSPNGEVKR